MRDISEVIIELSEYFPLDDTEVNEYISKLFTTFQKTYENEEFQFSYFALHLIFMTYIYCTVWKISRFQCERYQASLLFIRPYNGNRVNFSKLNSIFDYSFLPEKDIFEFLKLVEIDDGYIGSIKKLVDRRNDMAHASGKFDIIEYTHIETEIDTILKTIKNIAKKMEFTIRGLYEAILMKYSKNEFIDEYSNDINQIIDEVVVKDESLSLNDLKCCSELGISKFSDRNKYTLTLEEIEKIKDFHSNFKQFYQDYIGETKDEEGEVE